MSATPVSTSDSNPYWPEAVRDDVPAAPRFPAGLVVRWLLLPLIIAAVVLAGFVYFEQRASRQVAYIDSNGHLAIKRADSGGTRTLTFRNAPNATFAGMPQWSPNGGQVLVQGTVSTTATSQLMLVQPNSAILKPLPNPESTTRTLPAQAWSPSGRYVVAFGQTLQFIDVQQSSVVTSNLQLLTALFEWHPSTDELLATTFAEGKTALQVLTPNGTVSPFAPDDKQRSRWYGAWSPTGDRISYVASGDANSSTIWMANRDGSAPQQLVADGENTMPVWSPDGTFIFFTRAVTHTGSVDTYDLYRVRTNGAELARIGTSIEPLRSALAQNALIDWSPNGEYMFYQGVAASGERAIYLARPDGGGSDLVALVGNYATVQWMPNGRALLVADGSTTTVYGFDPKRNQATFLSSGSAALHP